MSRWKRKRVTVDWQVQGKLCLRIAVYWISCFLIIACLLCAQALFSTSVEAANLWMNYMKVASLSLLALPLVLFDSLIFSNKFCGPIYRLRKTVKDLADGKSVSPVELRPGDAYPDLGEHLNRLIARLESADQPKDEEPEPSPVVEPELDTAAV